MSTCQNPKCAKSFVPGPGSTGKYCSRSCAAVVNNSKNPKRKALPRVICLRCGKNFKGRLTRKFCSRPCFERYRAEEYIKSWLLGNEDGSSSWGEMTLVVRKYMLAEANYRCQSPNCYVPGGWGIPNPVTGKPILTIDHIDGNWKNNARKNLIVLCYNCHSLTETFGALNRGKGESNRVVGSRRHG